MTNRHKQTDAIAQLTQLLTDQTRVLGPDHPDTLVARNKLASRLAEAGRLDDAITRFTQLLTDETRVLGPDHPDTLVTRNNLAFLLGEAAEATDQPGPAVEPWVNVHTYLCDVGFTIDGEVRPVGSVRFASAAPDDPHASWSIDLTDWMLDGVTADDDNSAADQLAEILLISTRSFLIRHGDHLIDIEDQKRLLADDILHAIPDLQGFGRPR